MPSPIVPPCRSRRLGPFRLAARRDPYPPTFWLGSARVRVTCQYRRDLTILEQKYIKIRLGSTDRDLSISQQICRKKVQKFQPERL